MKHASQSKTVLYQSLKATVGSLVVGMAAFSGMIDPITFGIIMIVLNVIDSLFGVYLRSITTEPID